MSDFEEEFLNHYLALGLGSMPKSDIDALVMFLLDNMSCAGSPPLANYSNQAVSEKLRTPVNKIKRLRYDAGLKFGGRVEDQAKSKLLAAVGNASLEPDGEKICLIIEDALAKNWLQGQLKNNQLIFDHSFNTEIVKVSASGLFDVLNVFFDSKEIDAFRSAYQACKKIENDKKRRKAFSKACKQFAVGAARVAGASVFTAVTSLLGSG